MILALASTVTALAFAVGASLSLYVLIDGHRAVMEFLAGCGGRHD